MNVDAMTDGQLLIELRRHLAAVEFYKLELAKRANDDESSMAANT
jgi:hypothetical protein